MSSRCWCCSSANTKGGLSSERPLLCAWSAHRPPTKRASVVGERDLVIESSPGRFYFWGERALYLGPGLPATVHAHHAVQVCIPLSGTVRLRTDPGARWRDYEGAVIPSNCSHESDQPVSLIAAFWLEPDTAEARRLVQPRRGLLIQSVDRSGLTEIVQLLRAAWRDSFTSQRAAALTEEVVRILAPTEAPPRVIDRRVARALRFQASAPERRVSLAATAAAVSLSPS